MLKDFLQFILVVITAVVVAMTFVYIFRSVSCANAGRMLKTPSMYSFDKCYVMNADGDYIPEDVYLELLKYGE